VEEEEEERKEKEIRLDDVNEDERIDIIRAREFCPVDIIRVRIVSWM
jgi:ferredoxin